MTLDPSAILHVNDLMFSIMMMQAVVIPNIVVDRCRWLFKMFL